MHMIMTPAAQRIEGFQKKLKQTKTKKKTTPEQTKKTNQTIKNKKQ